MRFDYSLKFSLENFAGLCPRERILLRKLNCGVYYNRHKRKHYFPFFPQLSEDMFLFDKRRDWLCQYALTIH